MKYISKYNYSKNKKCFDCGKLVTNVSIRCYKCSFQNMDRNRRISKAKKGEKNPNWIGDKVGYNGVHSWLHRHVKKPDGCELCGKKTKLDFANISGKYLRDISDWEFLCRRCHMLKDGRLNSFLEKYNYA